MFLVLGMGDDDYLVKKMRRELLMRNSIALVGVLICICCLLVIMVSVLRLPDVFDSRNYYYYYSNKVRTISNRKASKDEAIGKLGEMMIQMLPADVAFTVFIPSQKAFARDLRLRVNDSLVPQKMNDTFAVVSRILGFSAIPRTLLSTTVPYDNELSFDSLSGFTLYISKAVDVDGTLVVNNRIRSERVDLRIKNIIVHVMDGVMMDAEFQQTLQPDSTEEED